VANDTVQAYNDGITVMGSLDAWIILLQEA